MTVAINDHDSEYGFTFWPPRIRRMSSQKLADVEFADEVALRRSKSTDPGQT